MDNNLSNKPLSVDVRLNPEQVKVDTSQIIQSISQIATSIQSIQTSIDNVFGNYNKKIDEANKKIAQTTEALHSFMSSGQLPHSTVVNQVEKGMKANFKQAKKNVLVESQITDQNYIQTREKQLLLQHQKKQIDNQLKIKNGLVEQTKHHKSFFAVFAKIGLSIATVRRLGSTMARLVKESGAWVENLNLFQVTFGKQSQEMLDFSINLAKNLGFSVNEMIRFTGLFKQLSTSIGVADETGTHLSKILTQLGLDITSFYNIQSLTQSMEKLQAGIFSGQTKPLRSIAVDVTYQSIDNLLKVNDALAQFNTTSKKLNQSQKVLARTILTLEASRNAWGDTAKTINTLTNQIRVFQGSMRNLALALGDTFAEPFRKALIYINAFIIAITDVIRAFHPLNKGNGLPINDSLKETNKTIHQTNEELEETEEHLGLLDIDKFSVLKTGSGQKSDIEEDYEITTALESELQKLEKEYEEITKSMSDMNNKAVEIAKNIASWFLVTDENGNLTKEFTKQAKGLAQVLAVFATLGVTKKIYNIVNATEKLAGILKILPKILTPTGLLITGIIVALSYMYATNEDFRKSINNLFKVILSALDTILKPTMGILTKIAPIIGKILEVVSEILTPIVNVIANVISFLDKSGLLQSALIGLINPIGGIISAIVSLYKNWRMVWQFIKSGVRDIGNLFVNLGVGIAEIFIGLVNILIDALNVLLKPLDSIASLFNGKVQIPHWEADISGAYNAIPQFAKGGIPDTGSLFVAGEVGAELVTNIGGQTNVVNMAQLTEAVSKGTLSTIIRASEMGLFGNDEGHMITVNLDGKEIYNSVKSTAKMRGEGFMKVR